MERGFLILFLLLSCSVGAACNDALSELAARPNPKARTLAFWNEHQQLPKERTDRSAYRWRQKLTNESLEKQLTDLPLPLKEALIQDHMRRKSKDRPRGDPKLRTLEFWTKHHRLPSQKEDSGAYQWRKAFSEKTIRLKMKDIPHSLKLALRRDFKSRAQAKKKSGSPKARILEFWEKNRILPAARADLGAFAWRIRLTDQTIESEIKGLPEALQNALRLDHQRRSLRRQSAHSES